MRPSFIFFCIVVILSFTAGFYFHEGLNEKVQYERDQCYEVMNKHLSTTNPYIINDLVLNDSFFDGGKSGGGGFGDKW